MKIKVVFTALAMTAVLFALTACSSDDNKKDETITWSITKFNYTTDGTTKHASYDAFKSELETACKQCEGKDSDAATPILAAVADKYCAEQYKPFVMDIGVTSSKGTNYWRSTEKQ